MNRFAEIRDIEELMAVLAASDHREASTVESPIVEQPENPKALWPDKGLGANDRHDEALAALLEAY
jgi:hypothetical protein